MRRHFLVAALGVAFAAALIPGRADAATFLDRPTARSVRVATWNIYFDSVFADVNATRSAKFARVAKAAAPDVWNFQEMYDHTASDVKSLLDSAQPLGTPGGWQVYKNGEHAIASRYPLTLMRGDTTPAGFRGVAMALVDLPNANYSRDLYMMNAHYKCCDGFDSSRQQQTDAFVNWMRNARTAGGSITLATGTPMIVTGDLNIVDALTPLDTLLSGDIQNNGVYGVDSPPDWDGSANSMAAALHNAVGPDDYTWRDDTSIYDPSRLDYITYTDSVITLERSFTLNTRTMSAADRTATQLQLNDSVYGTSNYDHLPVFADFGIAAPLLGDFNVDNAVNAGDLGVWRSAFGTTSGATHASADADGDGDVDGNDFLVWQRQVGSTPGAAASSVNVPEPAAWGWALAAALSAARVYRRPRFKDEASF